MKVNIWVESDFLLHHLTSDEKSEEKKSNWIVPRNSFLSNFGPEKMATRSIDKLKKKTFKIGFFEIIIY